MTHPRANIRDYFKTALVGASISGLTASSVFTNRSLPSHVSSLPACNISTLPEESEVAESCSAELRRTLTVNVDVTVKVASNDSVDTDLDALSDSIEAVFASDPTLGGAATDCTLTSTSFELNDSTGDYTVGRLRLTYTVTYFA